MHANSVPPWKTRMRTYFTCEWDGDEPGAGEDSPDQPGASTAQTRDVTVVPRLLQALYHRFDPRYVHPPVVPPFQVRRLVSIPQFVEFA